jgi:hypothetical protein
MKCCSQTRQAGPLAGPVLLFFLTLVLTFSSAAIFAQPREKPRVINSILGVRIGTTLDRARAKLDRYSLRESQNAREEREDESEESQESEESEGGRKMAWTLKSTDYSNVALKVDGRSRVVWITGFLRPGKEKPFAELGSLSSAIGLTDSRAVWNVVTSNGTYRLIAKGQSGKARVISLISLTSSRK